MTRMLAVTPVSTDGSKKLPSFPIRLPPAASFGTVSPRLADQVLHGLKATLRDQRSHLARGIHAVADLYGTSLRRKALDELVVDPLLHEKTGR